MNKKSWLESDSLSEKEKTTLFIEEAKLIQSIITRMATNSFLIKGWAITLIVGVFILKPEGQKILVTAFLPILGFWWLDAFFLHREKLYRKLYESQINTRKVSLDNLFSLDAKPYNAEVPCIIRIMFSPTLGTFYIVIFVLTLICLWLTTPGSLLIPPTTRCS